MLPGSFVCAEREKTRGIVHLRSYESDRYASDETLTI
jgi:hypothetical protein